MSACPPLKRSTVFCKKFLNVALFHKKAIEYSNNELCFLTLGIEGYGESNCDNVELLTQAKNAIPDGYTRNVFCAYSSVYEKATCKGDSGKYTVPNDSYVSFLS